ncbi:MAG: hypothetical protein P1U36_07675 [Legionellaceae bacterium]|nr:hypothetical protein [Legionellaceae bacterium]
MFGISQESRELEIVHKGLINILNNLIDELKRGCISKAPTKSIEFLDSLDTYCNNFLNKIKNNETPKLDALNKERFTTILEIIQQISLRMRKEHILYQIKNDVPNYPPTLFQSNEIECQPSQSNTAQADYLGPVCS